MDTRKVYEELMLDYYFRKMKRIRNGWRGSEDVRFLGVASLIDIEGASHRRYEFIMHSCSDIVYEMLGHVTRELIKIYEIPVRYYDLRIDESNAYYVGEDQYWLDYTLKHKEGRVLAFSRTDRQQEVLYVFKKFGIENRIASRTLVELQKAAKLECHFYISYVENDAYAEVINHNNNDNDPARGTGIYSYKQFFEDFFGKEEYIEFRKYADLFAEKVKDYLGFAIVRTLKHNAVFNFKKQLRDELERLDSSAIGASTGMDLSQRKIIEKYFFDDRNFEVLLGNSDFAQSFITAEWLHSSLVNAGHIDLVPIAMDYFKSIEQLLFAFLKNHTQERDGCNREVYVGKDKSYADQRGYVQLTDALVNDPEKAKDLMLGSLTGFFGYHDTNNNRYIRRNQDLLVQGINGTTNDYIIDVLGGVVGLRNGYVHKDNLNGANPIDREKVEEARKTAQLVFYLVLGAFSHSDDDKARLGLIRVEEHDDFYRLCEYVNQKAFEHGMLELPIVYINNTSDPYAFGFFYHDDYIEYDNYGDPIYSGVYFKEFGKDGRIIKLDRNHLPNEIWEGSFVISESIPIKMEPSGAKTRIFYYGKFVAN